ncbi:MAG: cyclomaltodextrinase / maltogenic alpha-amylase / neopullulanase [Oceanotoga sp.]|jgi:glycosidase|uniref:Maltogenic amylase n=1 Tax=Oceanotoga teriensis TaxID=515440 RepID=A0AA45HJF7_9BACT|nr:MULTISPECIES: alpha-amylase family glycosyl hydrolase [Oceanotoga]MDN5342383.1 cyclomaltodextrinase / maltogenic alpha-amylase / neopullulanase [Oceanotoga sp.]PWJ96176.1 maltogenic amylase [Oceanotoga teriensis]
MNKSYDNLKNSIIYEIFVRNHSNPGTFNDIYYDLERIKKLGVDIISFMPIYPVGKKNRKGTFGSPYSIRDYYSVSPEYGGMSQFKKILNKAHELEMKVFIDIVFHHTSLDSILYEEHPEWFLTDEKGNPKRKIENWYDIVELDFSNSDLIEYLIKNLEFWVDNGVDGFRCDTAGLIPITFWKKARSIINSKKNIIWIAETFRMKDLRMFRDRNIEVYSDIELSKVFDVTYDYDGFEYIEDYFKGLINFSYYINHLNVQKAIYPSKTLKLRFLENHDTCRICSIFSGKNIVKNWTIFYCLLPGPSLIFSGQEIMSKKSLKLFDKNSIRWEEGDYEFLSYFKKMIKIIKDIKEKCDIFNIHSIVEGVYLIEWKSKDEKYYIIVNLENRKGCVPINFKFEGFDIINNCDIVVDNFYEIKNLPEIFKIRP